jgi:DASH complex subunit ASK1
VRGTGYINAVDLISRDPDPATSPFNLTRRRVSSHVSTYPTLRYFTIMSQQPIHPALLQPPFYLIQGISPASPVSTQIEQIDQQNTLLLQDIDANFARFHQIVTTKILPEIKRFAIAGEPTREAAQVSGLLRAVHPTDSLQFWKAFFESAAQIKAPIAGDITGLTPSSPEHTYTDESTHSNSHHDSVHDDYATSSDASFFGNNMASSTPRPGGMKGSDSWDDSMESPFDKMDRRLRDDFRIGDGTSEMPTPSLPSGYDLPGLHDISSGTSEPFDLPRLDNTSRATSDTAETGLTPRAKRNIFHPDPTSGMTDLRTTPLNAKFPLPRSKNTSSASIPSFDSMLNAAKPTGRPKVSVVNTLAELQADMDDDDDLPMMSPPVTMAWNLSPRAKAIYSAGRTTPVKQTQRGDEGQARMILDDLLEEMASEPSPSMPTPEALRRYSVLPPAFGDSSARQLFPQASSSRVQPPPSRRSLANTSYGSDIVDGPVGAQPYDQGEDDSFDDSFDSDANQTIQPGADLLGDESYMSMSPTPGQAMSPTSEAGMVFGNVGRRDGGQGFALKKVDEMVTFFGGRMEDAALTESPLNGAGSRDAALAETP